VQQGGGSISQDGVTSGRWCILWTRAAHTLRLADTLGMSGIAAWTPRRIIKRDAPGHRRRLALGQRRIRVEVALPIVPGLVFASGDRVEDLFRILDDPLSEHPAFRVFHIAAHVPLVGEASVRGLRAAEAEALAAINGEREAETRKAATEERIKRLGTERARRKALRQESRALEPNTDVTIDDMPALAGIVGKVMEGQGTTAVIHFGGALTMTVEAWRVRRYRVGTEPALTGAAA
jgi:hypothetical protein